MKRVREGAVKNVSLSKEKKDQSTCRGYRRFLEGDEEPKDQLFDKKTPVGVIMIAAVQRERRTIVARIAAKGSWEIEILERHFRVSSPSSRHSPNNNLFQLLVPWRYRKLILLSYSFIMHASYKLKLSDTTFCKETNNIKILFLTKK